MTEAEKVIEVENKKREEKNSKIKLL